MTLSAGRPHPLGSTLTSSGCNFALFSEHATAIAVCLFDNQGNEVARHSLQERHGGIWHGHIEGITAGQHYNYRLDGPYEPAQGHIYNPSKLVIDPYAKKLSGTLEFNRALLWSGEHGNSDSADFVPKSIVLDNSDTVLEQNSVAVDPDQRIVYEVHVKGFTALNNKVSPQQRGKYLGLIEPAVIEHLQKLGVTTLQIMPCFSFMSEKRLTELELTNYWGYNPINFFSPDWRYANEDPVTEFKQMVAGLHNAGFEVILDVVYNHSAEGELEESYCAFKGIDNRAYYQFDGDGIHHTDYQTYRNASGCGNTINSSHPHVTQLILDSLRYWSGPMGLDGFRFDLAPILGRCGDRFDKHAAIFSAIRHDPQLSQKLLIAEPWDIGAHGYQLGNFPSHWFEVNDKFRDCTRAFWRGDAGLISDFTTRLMGSRDCFDKDHRNCANSVNCITYHDGFTLEDTVSYQHKHNHANGEDNRDGHGHNLSDNYGEEGPTHNLDIIALREQQKRNLVFSLLFARGTPHFLAGDELSNSQQGNNNAYCQDNDISWLDWELDTRKQDFLRFCQDVIALRKKMGSLNRLALPDEHYYLNTQHHDLLWLNSDGERLSEQQWRAADNHFLALHISEKRSFGFDNAAQSADDKNDRNALLLFNTGSKDILFKPAATMKGTHYKCLLNTACSESIEPSSAAAVDTIDVAARSTQLWVSVKM